MLFWSNMGGTVTSSVKVITFNISKTKAVLTTVFTAKTFILFLLNNRSPYKKYLYWKLNNLLKTSLINTTEEHPHTYSTSTSGLVLILDRCAILTVWQVEKLSFRKARMMWKLFNLETFNWTIWGESEEKERAT